jgi:glycosyltransferase involved in cell wall biosynthesis
MSTVHDVPRPKVSVCVITFNQEAYIGECLQSIVDQETDFEFEIIVGDDASTDSTRQVVQGFVDRYPDRVKPIFHAENIDGGSHNFRSVHLAARGEYVAHVDGDDYILPGKLQRQADLLDANPQVAFAAHAVRAVGGDRIIGADENYPEYGTVADLLRLGPYFVHSSVMYRRSLGGFATAPEKCIDFYLYVERAARGDIYLDRRVLGAYRLHPEGISKDLRRRKELESLYEAAFDRALELGVAAQIVQAGRLKRRMAFAVARYLSGDTQGYKALIRLSSADRRFASTKHILLHWTRGFPFLVGVYARWRGLM